MTTGTESSLERFEANRARLTGLAYRMLGELHEAQDVVQEAWLRWSRTTDLVREPEAWLTRVVANLCRTRLTQLARRRTSYVGPWLPEPVPTGPDVVVDLGPAETAEQRDTLSVGVLLLLERLTPTERAVFVLREAFGHSHREVAELLELDEATVRQHLHRARAGIGSRRQRFTADPTAAADLVHRFVVAAAGGDLGALEALLADDVVATSDGGGRVSAARRPIAGKAKVARFFAGIGTAVAEQGLSLEVAEVNAAPALLVRQDGVVTIVLVLEPDPATGRLARMSAVLNPDKLATVRHLVGRGIPAGPA